MPFIVKQINDQRSTVKYGPSGHEYMFDPHNERSKSHAKALAERQMRAIKWRQSQTGGRRGLY